MSQSSPTPDPVAWMVRSGAGHSIGQPELVEALARGNAERYNRLAGWRDKPYTVVPLYDHPSALPATTPSDTSVCQRPEDCTYASEGWCPRCEPCRRISPSEGSAPDTPTWREAASAPQTGEHILVTKLGRAGFGYCGVRNAQQDWCAVVHYWPVEDEEGFYLSSGASASVDDYPVHFTHWMPLP